jgi:hypothetical protein
VKALTDALNARVFALQNENEQMRLASAALQNRLRQQIAHMAQLIETQDKQLQAKESQLQVMRTYMSTFASALQNILARYKSLESSLAGAFRAGFRSEQERIQAVVEQLRPHERQVSLSCTAATGRPVHVARHESSWSAKTALP